MAKGESAFELMREIARLFREGLRPVVVHGGGPEIERMLSRLNIPTRKVQGLRVTDKDTIDIVEMALSGRVNKNLVGMLRKCGVTAAGVSGRDGALFTAEKKVLAEGDLGFVGTIVKTEIALIENLISGGFVPVISSIADDGDGQALNINADEAAAALAAASQASRLLLMTDVPGVLRNYPDPDSRIPVMTCREAEELLSSGIIDKGMIPKIRSCVEAVRRGVGAAHIIDGRSPDALRQTILGGSGSGTTITETGSNNG